MVRHGGSNAYTRQKQRREENKMSMYDDARLVAEHIRKDTLAMRYELMPWTVWQMARMRATIEHNLPMLPDQVVSTEDGITFTQNVPFYEN